MNKVIIFIVLCLGLPLFAESAQNVRVAGEWQDVMLKELEDLRKTTPKADLEVWGLFSSGGWSNTGQVFVIKLSTNPKARLYRVKPNSTAEEPRSHLKPKSYGALTKSLAKTDQLVDVYPVAFDALTYEFIHITWPKTAAAPTSKRLLIRDLGDRDIPEHRAVIKTLQDLLPKP